jgi:hypothetical protein
MKTRTIQGAAALAITALAVLTAGAASAATTPSPAPTSPSPASPVPSPSPSSPAAGPAGGAQLTSPGDYSYLCLTNATSWCASATPSAVIGTASGERVILDWVPQAGESGAPAGQEGTERSEGPGAAGQCLADTGGPAFWTSCSGNGTVWVLSSHNNGYALVSRYLWNRGDGTQLLTAALVQGSPLFTAGPGYEYQAIGWEPAFDQFGTS